MLKGHRTHSFGHPDGTTQEARALNFPGGAVFALGDYRGSPVLGPDGKVVPNLGLNRAEISRRLLELSCPEEACGHAHIRRGAEFSFLGFTGDFGIIFFLRQAYQIDPRRDWRELKVALHGVIVLDSKSGIELDGESQAKIFRAPRVASPRRSPPSNMALLRRVSEAERGTGISLRRPEPDAAKLGLRHAVTPLFAAVVSA